MNAINRDIENTLLKFMLSAWLMLFGMASHAQEFQNRTSDYGLAIYHDANYSESGVSFHDFNRDGLDDLTYCSMGMGVYTFRNTSAGFVQEYYFAGLGGDLVQPSWIDYDNDGDADFFATRFYECPVLFRNNGDMTFEDVSENLPCAFSETVSSTATWADYNGDGWLDVHICNFNLQPFLGSPNWLYRNNGDGTFSEVAEEAGLNMERRAAWQSMFIDVDFDSDADLLVVNDKFQGCSFYENNAGYFTDIATENGFDVHINAMALSVSDIDHDGDYDFYISNTEEGNVLLLNENGVYTDRAQEWGGTVNAACWGSVFIDTQLKSWEDVYVVNTGPVNGLNVLLKNNFGTGFTSMHNAMGGSDNEYIYSIAKGDSNNDGAYDIVTMPYFADGTLLMEATQVGSTWVKFGLQGTVSNRDGIGATLRCYAGGSEYIRAVTCGENFTSQDSRYLIVGLNAEEAIDSVVVRWPSGMVVNYGSLPIQQLNMLVEPSGEPIYELAELTLCEGHIYELDLSEWESVLWDNGSIEFTFLATGNDTLNALAYDSIGQSYLLEFRVTSAPVPNPEWDIHASICGGNDARVEAGNAVVSAWVNEEMYSLGQSGLASGTWDVLWLDTLGCTHNAIWNIPNVEPMHLHAETDTACFGEDVDYLIHVLNGVEPYIWLGIDSPIGSLPSGSYSFSCIDARGCMTTTQMILHEREPWQFNVQVDTACYGSTAEGVYTWSGAVSPVVQLGSPLNWEALQPGEYEVEWMDAAGCEMETQFEVVEYEPIEWEVDIMGVSENAGGQLTLNIEGGLPPYSVLWSSGAQGTILEDLDSGSYSALIADAAGCSVATEDLWVPISVEQHNHPFALMYDSDNGLCNRANHPCKIQIIDAVGKIISREIIASGATLSCRELAPGCYLVLYDQQVLRFVKED
jgi:hypothetical protein